MEIGDFFFEKSHGEGEPSHSVGKYICIPYTL